MKYQILQKEFGSKTFPYHTNSIPLSLAHKERASDNPSGIHQRFTACCQHDGAFTVRGCLDVVAVRGES